MLVEAIQRRARLANLGQPSQRPVLGSGRYRMKQVALLLAASIFSSNACAQNAEAIGSWWVIDAQKVLTAAGRHTAFTQSTQGAGAVALQCASKRVAIVLGLNQSAFTFPAGSKIQLEYRAGDSPARAIEAVVQAKEAVELGDSISREIISEVVQLPVFSFRVPLTPTSDVSLVFRPIETERAIRRLADACEIQF